MISINRATWQLHATSRFRSPGGRNRARLFAAARLILQGASFMIERRDARPFTVETAARPICIFEMVPPCFLPSEIG
jgi:hypothetical protein